MVISAFSTKKSRKGGGSVPVLWSYVKRLSVSLQWTKDIKRLQEVLATMLALPSIFVIAFPYIIGICLKRTCGFIYATPLTLACHSIPFIIIFLQAI